jgi:hypothetical protein
MPKPKTPLSFSSHRRKSAPAPRRNGASVFSPGLGPMFFFSTDRWRGSAAVRRMSMSQRGVYLEMLIEEWEHGSLPDSAAAIAEAIAASDDQEAEVLAAFPVVRRRFAKQHGRLTNARMQQLRDARIKQLDQSRAAAAQRWAQQKRRERR